MHRRFALIAGAALLATGLGMAQKPAPKTAAVPIVVYKSPT